jgi:hypothetical protein
VFGVNGGESKTLRGCLVIFVGPNVQANALFAHISYTSEIGTMHKTANTCIIGRS